MLVFALLTVPAIAIEQSDAGTGWDTAASLLNWAIWLAFVAEAAIMLRLVEDRGAWLRDHPLEIAIIVLTPPFLPASLQTARAFRLLRLLRLVRAGVAARRLLSTEGVRDAAVLALVTILGGGAAYASVETGPGGETLSAWDGVWWALTTVTTVGYGDSFPTTDLGRMIAIAVMLVGIGFVAILTGAAAERFLRAGDGARPELDAIEQRLAEISARLDALGARRPDGGSP